ncbi:MAG: NAD(P)/FAD-dependent oxidoreductase, partial [Pseudomonadales bacterium]
MSGVIIVGAGHAAGQAVASLRQEGYTDAITIIGDEPHVPYQRPPLSKHYLAGTQGLERVYLRPEKFYGDKDITLKLGTSVASINPAEKSVTTDGDETLEYDKLILATGSRPRKLSIPGSDLAGIHYLRTIADVDAIRAEMGAGKKIVIVGGGYIGLEVASVCVEA